MAEGFEEKLLQRLAQIKIAIESTNPDPQQSIQAYREQRDAQQRAADQLIITTRYLVRITNRLGTAIWALVVVTAIMAASQIAPFFLKGGK
jgi:hypothetical protein